MTERAGPAGGARPLRVLFVPLSDDPFGNPSDRRRMVLPARCLRRRGVECVFSGKEEALGTPADVIFSQDRDYGFWLRNAARLGRHGAALVFSFSDLLGYEAPSRAHHYAAYTGTARPFPPDHWRRLIAFLEQCRPHVVAGSRLQAEAIARLAPSLPVEVIHDSIDTDVYHPPPAAAESADRGMTLVWEGCSDNLPYLLVCAEAIRRIARRAPVRVLVATTEERRNEFMGTKSNRKLAEMILGEIAEFHVWGMDSIAGLMSRAHAGIAPLFTDCPFALAKPPHKAVICNSMRLPVVASPVPAYAEYVEDGLNGFIAATPAEWEERLDFLRRNPAARARMGEYGRRKAAEGFSPEAAAERLHDLLRRLAGAAAGGAHPSLYRSTSNWYTQGWNGPPRGRDEGRSR
ncbi:MAG: glycosyltransferase family 4 protein [bacterium]|nr:glycosyltransferase family 4 protein [bacterium]